MIQVAHIKKKYRKKMVLEDINFTINPGEIVAIIGENGCGKSTLLKILAGVIKPDEGDFSFFETHNNHNKICGYVPQENPLLEDLSVRDNLFLWGGKNALQQKSILEEFQLEDLLDTTVKQLSGGMKRRLSIASAMLKSPVILLLDEPTAGLDFYYKEQMLAWMNSFKKKNGIVLMVTHDEDEIMNADRCILIENGKAVELEKETLSEDKIKQMINQKYL